MINNYRTVNKCVMVGYKLLKIILGKLKTESVYTNERHNRIYLLIVFNIQIKFCS